MKLRHIPALLAPLLLSLPSHAKLDAQSAAQTLTEVTQALKQTLVNKGLTPLNEQAGFTIKRRWTDELGKTHTHFSQTINGIPVYGTDVITHANAPENGVLRFNAAANIYGVSGQPAIAADTDARQSRQSLRSTSFDLKHVLANAALIGDIASKPALAYVYLPESGDTKLAWKVDVKYNSDNGFEHDIVFFDASNGAELTRHPQVHRARDVRVYDMENNAYSSSFSPGTFLCDSWVGNRCDSGSSGERAYDGVSAVYNYYKNVHGRDGLDNRGIRTVASVHTGNSWNNAAWYNNQLFFGDGDGYSFRDLTYSFDVIAHEYTHGVIRNTADLIANGESGALNEAMADIFGVSAEAWHRSPIIPKLNWLIGEDTYTPNTTGDALRYMNNPTKDGKSRDWYPNLYTGSGGNHWNSGIANLAFALLVDGGSHPRGLSTEMVPAIGFDKAQKIFYRALTTYFTQATTFAQAREATISAAQALYPWSVGTKKAVEMAWCIVGVGECPNPLDTIALRSRSSHFNDWVQCRGSFAIWPPQEAAQYYIISFAESLSAPISQWRQIYKGSGIYNTYSGVNIIERRLLNDGYFGIQACDSNSCGVLSKSETPLIANHQGCAYRE
ncbi:MAG: M4 family metallopeptidase [Psychrosphaera sp.]|nr:M4 family metallopeptidase [Psychrosphaera sp.]